MNLQEKRTTTFIIPHRGRFDLLWQTLAAVSAQSAESGDIEILLCSQDRSLDQRMFDKETGNFPAHVTARLIEIEAGATISVARNVGSAQATGDFLAFIDADVMLPEKWLETMHRLYLDNPDVVLFGAVQKPDTSNRVLDRIRSDLSHINAGSDVQALTGQNLFLSAAVFNRSEKFPEHLRTCEDSTFTGSLLSMGKLLLTDQTFFVHLGEDLNHWHMFKKEVWRGQSNLSSLKENPFQWREMPSIVLPPVVLVSLLIAIVLLISGRVAGAAFFLLMACFPVVVYALRLKTNKSVDTGFTALLKFYLVYFPARALGMITGVYTTLTRSAG